MAAAPRKKTVLKKTAVKKKAVKPISVKSAKSSGKAKKSVAAKKPVGKIASSPKTAAKKRVASKTAAPRTAAVKKPLQKTDDSQNRLRDIRKSLLLKKEHILKEVKEEISKYVSGENKQLVDTALDDGDWALVDISEDISLLRLSAHRKLMHNIDEAIRKIGEGTYGICEECNGEISEKRLLVLPTATLCIDCQEHKEQFEAFAAESEE